MVQIPWKRRWSQLENHHFSGKPFVQRLGDVLNPSRLHSTHQAINPSTTVVSVPTNLRFRWGQGLANMGETSPTNKMVPPRRPNLKKILPPKNVSFRGMYLNMIYQVFEYQNKTNWEIYATCTNQKDRTSKNLDELIKRSHPNLPKRSKKKQHILPTNQRGLLQRTPWEWISCCLTWWVGPSGHTIRSVLVCWYIHNNICTQLVGIYMQIQ